MAPRESRLWAGRSGGPAEQALQEGARVSQNRVGGGRGEPVAPPPVGVRLCRQTPVAVPESEGAVMGGGGGRARGQRDAAAGMDGGTGAGR